MEFTGVCPYALQIDAHIKNRRHEQAYNLSKDFVNKHPNVVVSHFMLAKSALRMQKYNEAEEEGLRAFNLAHQSWEMSMCAIIVASAMFMQKRYRAGYMLLNRVKLEGNEDAIKLSMIFAIVLRDTQRAEFYYDSLSKINRKVAQDFIIHLSCPPLPK